MAEDIVEQALAWIRAYASLQPERAGERTGIGTFAGWNDSRFNPWRSRRRELIAGQQPRVAIFRLLGIKFARYASLGEGYFGPGAHVRPPFSLVTIQQSLGRKIAHDKVELP